MTKNGPPAKPANGPPQTPLQSWSSAPRKASARDAYAAKKSAPSKDNPVENQLGGDHDGGVNPLQVIREEHALQYALCDLLETVADGLPKRFDVHIASIAVTILSDSHARHVRFEEEALFPALRRRIDANDPLHLALDCLSSEHDCDSASVEEIIDGLRTAIGDGLVQNPEMLGYMLRGYFESQRRHTAWEDAVVLSVAETVLTREDLDTIRSWLATQAQPSQGSEEAVALMDKIRSGMVICDPASDVLRRGGRAH